MPKTSMIPVFYIGKIRGRALYQARFTPENMREVVGAGNSHANAVKDWRKQYRLIQARGLA